MAAERRTQAADPPREVTTFKLRDEWVRLAAVQKLSPILRVVGMRLAHFLNGTTGQLNPSYALLALECNTSERTAQKAVAAFRKLRMIADTRSTGGRQDATNDFTLIIPYRRVSRRTPVKSKSGVSNRTPLKSAPRGVRAGVGGVSRSAFEGCPPGHPNSVRENSVRNSERGFAARSSDDDSQSAPTNTATERDAASSQRAPDGALIEADEDHPQPTCAPPASIGTPTTAANGARATFADVSYAWPSDRTDDEGYEAYVAALAAARGDTDIVLDAVWARLEESGADPPWLSDALRRIEHDLRHGNPEEDEDD